MQNNVFQNKKRERKRKSRFTVFDTQVGKLTLLLDITTLFSIRNPVKHLSTFFTIGSINIKLISRNIATCCGKIYSLISGHSVWKFRKFSLIEKIFREINSLVTYLVKRDNCRDFHTVCLKLCAL